MNTDKKNIIFIAKIGKEKIKVSFENSDINIIEFIICEEKDTKKLATFITEYNRTYKEANVSYTIEDIIKRIRNTFPYEFEYYDVNSAFVLNV